MLHYLLEPCYANRKPRYLNHTCFFYTVYVFIGNIFCVHCLPLPKTYPTKTKGAFCCCNSSTGAPNKLEQFRLDNSKLIDVAINNIRTAAYNLLPKVLYDFGLIEALEDLCELMSRGTNIDISFFSNNTLTPSKVLTKQSELTIYRIVMEIVNNAVKYSKATSIKVKVDLGNETCNISVTDNGIGFDVNNILINKNH